MLRSGGNADSSEAIERQAFRIEARTRPIPISIQRKMRTTIAQRQDVGGSLRQRQEYYVDCTIELSDDERQRIKANPDTLLNHVIAGGHDMSYGEFRWSSRSYSQSAPFMLV